jgi:tetratricopeptide (TPR) repeat protein
LRVLLSLVIIALMALAPRMAHADAVDEAFAEGNDAAERNDWPAAVAAYEEAAALLPHRNAVLSYNLGTAYANEGDLGRAMYHLHRAMDWRGGPSADVLEAARANIAVVRRSAELQATRNNRMIDRPQTSWDLIVEAFEAPMIGWLTLLSGWILLVVLWLHRRRLRAGLGRLGITRATLVVLAICYLVPGVLHGWAIRAAGRNPEAIVLHAQVDAREGPGTHRKVEFTLQGGARVRVVDRSPGWQLVRLPGGVTGWVREQSIGRIDAARGLGARASPS